MTKISYNINNSSRNIYLEKNILKFILQDIEKFNSDRKILLIFDKNVDSKFIKNTLAGLKIKGSKVIIAEAEGSKIKKNEKLLFRIIDIFIQNKFTKRSVLICIGGGVIGDVSFSRIIIFKRNVIF